MTRKQSALNRWAAGTPFAGSVLLGLAFLHGCGAGKAPVAAPPEVTANEAQAAPAINYEGWPATTEELVPTSEYFDHMCRVVPPDERQAILDAYMGPHATPAIRLFTNESARSGWRSDGETMPVGSIIVKEKWRVGEPTRFIALAAMIKREAGYDAEHGDWEYLYQTFGERGEVTRGRLGQCIDCHTRGTRDFVFGDHLDRGL